MRLLHIVHGSRGGIGRVDKLLQAVWARQPQLEVRTVRRMTYPPYLDPAAPDEVVKKGGVRWPAHIVAAFVQQRPDLVVLGHLNFTPVAPVFRLLRPRVRLVVWAYGVEAWRRPTWLRRLGLRFVDQVWAISRHTRQEFAAAAGVPLERIVVVPLALLPGHAEELGRRPRVGPNGRCEVLTVSRLEVKHGDGKGIDHLIQVLKGSDPRVQLVVVGDGEDRDRLNRLAREAGVESRVRFLGQVDDTTLSELYRQCRVFALPSLREGFGLAFLEAMAAGKPVVAARAAATPEVVRDQETGLLVPYGDRAALTHAIDALVADPTRASALGRRGQEVIEQEFSFERFANQVAELVFRPVP